MSSKGTIERSALGRIATLGDLYDARSDSFCGFTMFKAKIPDTLVTTTDNNSSKTDFVYDETLQEKSHKLNISAELSISIACLPITASGSAKFMQDQKSSTRSVRTTFTCDVTTKVDQLGLFNDEIKNYIASDALKDQGATHVVIGVSWGGSAYVSAEIDDTQMSKEELLEGNMKASLKLAMLEASASAEIGWNENTKSLAKRVTTKVYADVLPDIDDQLPITFDLACQQVQQLQARISKANDGKGKPMSYTLFPLDNKQFRDFLAITQATELLYRQIEEAALAGCVQLLDSILEVKMRINDLVNDCNKFSKGLHDKMVTKARQLQSSLVSGERTLRAQIGNALKEIRAGNENVSKLDELMVNYLASEVSHIKVEKSYRKDFMAANTKMGFIKSCHDFGVVYMRGYEPIQRLLLQNENVYVLYASDDLMIKDQAKWNKNLMAFFNIAKMIRYDAGLESESKQDAGANKTNGRSVLVFVDCTFNPLPDAEEATKDGVRIIQYKNARQCDGDVAEQQAIDLSMNMARSTTLKNLRSNTEQKTMLLKIRCPGVRLGECESTPREWICYRCRQSLQVGLRDDNIYCQCGRAAASTFTFRCQDILNHKSYEFKSFPTEDLQFELLSLRGHSSAGE